MSQVYGIALAVGVGGFCGAVARHFIAGTVARWAGPEHAFAGTAAVNLIGCLLIGFLTAVLTGLPSVPEWTRKLLITGLLGSLTTYSTFALESVRLLENQRYAAAVGNIFGKLLVGLILVWMGLKLGETLAGRESSAAAQDSSVQPPPHSDSSD